MTKVSRELKLLRATLATQINGPFSVQVLYQPTGAASGLIVTFDVYKPDRTQDIEQSDEGQEIGQTGRYYLSFMTDGPGWFVLIHDNAGGSGVRQY